MGYRYKAGDTVECLQDLEGQFTKGKTYTVSTDNEINTERVSVVEDDKGEDNGWLVGFFRPAVAPAVAPAKPGVRTFSTGATRDTDENKLDFEGFLSPLVMEAFAEYMHSKRKMPDGSMRDSDNWQKGIPTDAYMKSMFRHFFAVWKSHRQGGASLQRVEELLALMFNVQGYIHEMLKQGKYTPNGL